MEEHIDLYHVYVQTDEQGRIIAVNSSAFVPESWGTEIDSGLGDKYRHAQGNYFTDGLYTEDGIPLYKLVEGKAQEVKRYMAFIWIVAAVAILFVCAMIGRCRDKLIGMGIFRRKLYTVFDISPCLPSDFLTIDPGIVIMDSCHLIKSRFRIAAWCNRALCTVISHLFIPPAVPDFHRYFR